MQLDEATDNSRNAHLICYIRFADFSEQILEELLFCKPVELGCGGINLFNIIENFLSKNNLDRKKGISLCTDGAKAMSGGYCGLQSLIQKFAPMAKWTHCMIHLKALVAQDPSPELGETVKVITIIINYIKTRPSKPRVFQKLWADMNAEHRSLLFCSSRWLSLEKSF